jgi:metal-sulfur cluster biosynthetic enzyme
VVSKNTILEALRKVYDPEIPVNLVDLGLIYDTSIENDKVSITMTLTATACPMHTIISQNVKTAVESLDGVSEAIVNIVWEPRWSPEMISPEGRSAMGME